MVSSQYIFDKIRRNGTQIVIRFMGMILCAIAMQFMIEGKDIKFVAEHNPPLDSAVLRQLATAIEINREEFFSQQRLLVARQNEHKTFIQTFPVCVLLPGAQEVKITVIKSDHTADIYATGKENI